MTLKRMEHVGVVVDDLPAAVEFFTALGLEPRGEGTVGGDWVDRIIGLQGTEAEMAMMRAPDGSGELELVKFHSPRYEGDGSAEPSNAPGIRHLTFLVEDVDAVVADLEAHGGEVVGEIVRYEDIYRLCYLRGPAGIIVEIAEKLS